MGRRTGTQRTYNEISEGKKKPDDSQMQNERVRIKMLLGDTAAQGEVC